MLQMKWNIKKRYSGTQHSMLKVNEFKTFIISHKHGQWNWGQGGMPLPPSSKKISKLILNIVSRIHEDPSMLQRDTKCAHSTRHKHWMTTQLVIAHHPKNWKTDTSAYSPTKDYSPKRQFENSSHYGAKRIHL